MIDPTNPLSLHHPDTEPLTQLRAAQALLSLIQEDAPAADWTLTDDGRRLSGQIMTVGRTDTDSRQALAAWQRVTGAGPVKATPHRGTEHLRIVGSYDGVPVHVMTIVSSAEGEVAA